MISILGVGLNKEQLESKEPNNRVGKIVKLNLKSFIKLSIDFI